MGIHQAAVFSYGKYQNGVRWLVEQVGQGNYEPLRECTCKVIRRLRQEWPLSDLGWSKYANGVEKEILTQEWPLLDHGGGSLVTEDEIRNLLIPAPRDLGYWFLIVLAEYLQPCPSPLGNWSVLNAALQILGWDRSDCDLLFRGLPTFKLLKPRTMRKSVWPLKNSDPYWLWMHPGRARSGWLPLEQISILYSNLCKMEDQIKTFDVCQIPSINVDNPIVIRDYKGYLQFGYRDTLAMLSTAQKLKRGLFMSVTLP